MDSRIAVIGQSNSIISTGFVHQLARLGGIEIGNMARLGASPSILLPFFGDDSFFEGHEFAIFDLAIVDQGFLWAGAVDPYAIVQWLEYGIWRAHAAGCIPILLVIPHQAVIPPLSHSAAAPLLQQLYRSVAARNGAPCFDLFDAITRRVWRSPEAMPTIYSDPDHLSEAFSGEVAEQILRFITALRGERLRYVERSISLPSMARIPLGGPDLRVEKRQSSLLSAEFCILHEGEHIDLPTGPVTRMHGALLNRAGSDGKLLVEGDEAMVKLLGTRPETDMAYVAQLVPFLTPIRDRDGQLRVGVAPAEAATTEPSWQAQDIVLNRVEIAELLVETGTKPLFFNQPLLPPPFRQTDWFQA
jgi:hypothetical protein